MTAPADRPTQPLWPQPVEATTAAHGIRLDNGTPFPVWVRFIYAPADPYALTLVMSDQPTFADDCTTVWTVARETVYVGCELRSSAGYGDFYANYISEQTVQFAIHAPNIGDTDVVIDVPRPKLSAFLQRTEVLVPVGRESEIIDLDRLITQLERGY